EGTLGVYSDFSVGGNSTLLGQLEVNDKVSALSNVIVSDDVIATGMISADSGINKSVLPVDPTVGVEVIGHVITDPITSIGAKASPTPSADAWSAGWRFVVAAGQTLVVSHLLYAYDS